MLELTAKALVVEVAAPASRPIRVKWLAAGQVLAADVEANDGVVLARAGAQITGALLERIRNFAELSGSRSRYAWFRDRLAKKPSHAPNPTSPTFDCLQ